MLEKIQQFFGFKGDQAPNYGQSMTGLSMSDWSPYNFQDWWLNRDTTIDYRRDVGRFEDSSLVMPIVNDTGIAIAEAEPSVRRRDAQGKWQPEPDHPMAELIKRPNQFFIWEDYCGALSLSWWIDGNVYFYKVRDNSGNLIELWYLPHFWVKPRWPNDGRTPEVPLDGNPNPFLSHYQYNIPGKEPVLYPAADIVHLKRFVDPFEPRRGIGAFGPVIREIYGDNAVASFSATLMRNMGMVPYLLAPKEPGVSLGPTEAEAIKDSWLAKTSGSKIGLPVVNSLPLDVTKLGLDPKELDLSGLAKRFETRIAAVSRYPAAYLQFLSGIENGTSYASYKEAREQAYEQVVIPIQRTIGSQFTRQVLPELDKNPKGLQFFFDTSTVRVLQEDRDALYKRETEALRAGGITVNQYLASLGKEAVNGGDIYYVPRTSLPLTLETLIEIAKDPTALQAAMPAEQALAGGTNAASVAKFMDMERLFADLETQMKGFVPK